MKSKIKMPLVIFSLLMVLGIGSATIYYFNTRETNKLNDTVNNETVKNNVSEETDEEEKEEHKENLKSDNQKEGNSNNSNNTIKTETPKNDIVLLKIIQHQKWN